MKVLVVQKMAGVAGSETYYLNLLPRLVEAGVNVHFLCVQHPANAPKNELFKRRLSGAGVCIYTIDSRFNLSPTLLLGIRRIIAAEGFDVVQTNLIHADVWLAFIKAFIMPEIRLISVKHGYSEVFQIRHGLDPKHVKTDLFSVLTRWANSKADRIISISAGLQNLLTGSGLAEPEKCMVIPYGFSPENVGSDLPPGETRLGTPQLLIVARLVEYKQHHLVFEILPDLVARFPGIKLLLLGTGPREAELKVLAKSLGIQDNVVFVGFKTNVHDYLRDSDVMILPSVVEGFGLVILEALCNRKPVVAFDVPAMNEILKHGSTGLLAPPFEKAALRAAILRLLDDPALAKRIGEQGYAAFRSRYSIEVMTERTLSVYTALAATSVRAGGIEPAAGGPS